MIDEPETGLEPYRQRVFIRDLAASPRQIFVTTHAPAVLAQALREASQTWRIGDAAPTVTSKSTINGDPPAEPNSHVLVALEGTTIATIVRAHPEALFAKLPVICEGLTEVGFATRVLEDQFGPGYSCRGLFCLDAGGHYQALPVCKELIEAGFPIAAIVDDEGKKVGSWGEIRASAILLRWQDGASLEVAVLSAMPDSMLREVHGWVDEAIQRNAIHQLAELRRQLGLEKGLTPAEMFELVGRDRFLQALIACACPKPEGNRKPRGWFKSFEGGYLLADKLISVKPRPALMAEIEAFLSSVERATAP